jgi:hypothetical protein
LWSVNIGASLNIGGGAILSLGDSHVVDQILVEIIDKHLPYEIDMLRSTYRQLESADNSASAAETPEQKAFRNAPIESFCVHARSLINFFANHRNVPTDAIAGDFTDGFTASIDPSKQPIRTLITKLNKHLSHLTRNRTLVATGKFDGGVDGRRILQEIEPAIERFTACLTVDFRSFKCSTEPVKFADFIDVPHATSTG